MQFASLLLPLLMTQGNGLQIKDITVGSGPSAEPGDQLAMDYTGTLMNGKVFDTSLKPGAKPFEFVLGIGQVIPGWDQGVVGMKVGGKRVLVIPPKLAYGERGAGADIPPNATLKFVIELRKITSHHVKKEILRPGMGAPIKMGDSVTLHYTVTLPDGSKLDSSYDHGAPMTTVVGGRMIPGFTLGLIGAKEGEKLKMVIPWQLAYGEQGRPPKVPPKSDLTFVVEFMKVTHS
jgi:FKBP-type peptidyl-prolyl cis-trans isomerase